MAGDPDDCPGDMYNRRFMNWMSFLDTSSQLTNVFIPGTHESATYSMRSWLPNGPGLDSFPDYISQTQSFNLLGQLLAGIRYFDLRTEEVTEDGESVAIFHHGSSAIKDTKGRQVSPVVADQLLPFIDAFPSEFIIFDFQEISSYVGSPSWMVSQLQDIINQYLNPATLAIPAGSVTSDLTMGDIWQGGWQYMVIFSEKAIEAATADNVTIEPWVVPRLPGNSQPIGPGRFWDPWDSTIWGGGVGGIIQAIGSNGAQMGSACLTVPVRRSSHLHTDSRVPRWPTRPVRATRRARSVNGLWG